MTLCDYIILMKCTNKIFNYPDMDGAAISVREAKAQFSSLVGRAAEGEVITITWHGQPRARLVPISAAVAALRVDRDWLKSMSVQKRGVDVGILVRDDRDARG
ncbi:MAG: type II toxin-antitoxin system prevent-host-death family antitoxin [bacterium]